MSKGITTRKRNVAFTVLYAWGSLLGGAQDPFQLPQDDPFAAFGGGFSLNGPDTAPTQPASQAPVPVAPAGDSMPALHEDIKQQISAPTQAASASAGDVSISDEEKGETGNWLKKKEWVKQGRELESAIHELLVEAQAAKVSLYEKQGGGIEKDLEQFQQESGMSYGEVDGIVAEVQAYLDKRLAKARDEKDTEPIVKPTGEVVAPLSVYELQDQVDARKVELEQLKLDMAYVGDLDKALSERIKKSEEMVDYILKHSQEADQVLAKMWHIIDHSKARQKYYEMNDHYEKIKAAVAYLKGDLSQNFEQVVTEIRNQMRKCSESIKKLEDKDLIIKSRKQRLDDIRAKQKEAEEAAAKKLEAPKKSRKDQQEKSFFVAWYDSVSEAFSDFWKWVTGFFASASSGLQVAPRKNKSVTPPGEATLTPIPAPVK